MDATKLKRLTIEKLSEEIPLANINEPLVDKLVAEFCEKNPQEFAVLNPFSISDEELKDIKENIKRAIADGIIERLKYEQVVNHAGLTYQYTVFAYSHKSNIEGVIYCGQFYYDGHSNIDFPGIDSFDFFQFQENRQ